MNAKNMTYVANLFLLYLYINTKLFFLCHNYVKCKYYNICNINFRKCFHLIAIFYHRYLKNNFLNKINQNN